ncbi:uncharacterized protein EV420DRAFT_1636517 [Desarmillaria tabescens]|uniref:Uncharacterized protein n=1 Tax=Armillaria tabescens TaxID=1929756 RepID=A0AA39NHY6_ARMTA|nr:uncharacterized protein EV420DRAFT_1636517 [Desarmillaria tabescens]KAK0465965.1 hypothetical protein EV420DRAFT_1636517 [Desarmillaria tabescens]
MDHFTTVVFDESLLCTLHAIVSHDWHVSSIAFILLLCSLYILQCYPYLILEGNCKFSDIPPRCVPALEFIFVGNITAIAIIQAMLVLRVWYLFSASKKIRIITVSSFILSLTTSMLFSIVAALKVKILQADIPPSPEFIHFEVLGCQVSRPPMFWRIYLPSLFLHTLLYILTAFRALQNRRTLKQAPVMKRLLRDGGLFFFIVFVSVGFTSIGSFFDNYPQLNIVVMYSNFLVTVTSIAVSRVMFSIHSLAAHLGSDTVWLLNNVELSRVNWRRGNTEGEIIVEECSRELDDEEASRSDQLDAMKTTRIGVYNERAW